MNISFILITYSFDYYLGIDIVVRKLMFGALWTVISENTDK